jgi:uncharacterized RDD family membrane protein YckC
MATTAPAARPIEDINLATAGFLQRWVASLIDTLVLSPLFFLYQMPFMKSNIEGIITLPEAFYQWGWWRAGALMAALFCYGWLLVGFRGRTVGMAALYIRVTRLDASPVGYGPAALRALSYFLPMFVFYAFPASIFFSPLVLAAFNIGLLWIMVDRAHQGYHDKISRTLVMRDYYLKKLSPSENQSAASS